MKNKKILFIIPYLVGGGALKTVGNLSKEMANNNEVTIVGIFGSESKFEFTGELIELNMVHQKKKINKLRDFFRIVKFLKKLKEERNFDYSISFLVVADMVNVFSRSSKKEKTIISIRNNESVEYKDNWFRRTQVKIALKLSDYIVAISREVEEDLKLNFNVPSKKLSTIYNPCVINMKNEKIDESIFVENKTVITLGGLKYQKGQWHLIRAFSKVVESIPDARLLIFGKGDYKEYLESIISNYNLTNNIKLCGYVMNPHDYVVHSDVFVFSSIFEGLGNAMMETLKCSIPVISTDYSCGAREILAPNSDFMKKVEDKIDYAQYGILVPVCDGTKYTNEKLTFEEELLADAIIEVLTNKKLRDKYSEMAKIRASNFEIENIVSQWYDLLEEIK